MLEGARMLGCLILAAADAAGRVLDVVTALIAEVWNNGIAMRAHSQAAHVTLGVFGVTRPAMETMWIGDPPRRADGPCAGRGA